MTYPLFRQIASTIDARLRCLQTDNPHATIHTAFLEYIERNLLPSGAGVDSGTTIDLDKSTGDKVILHTSYHHMNEGGCYDGWTEHTITVRASLIHELDLTISGRNRNDIKTYLYDLFNDCLSRQYAHTYDKATEQHELTEVAK
jgi:hypothetical protein